MSTTLITGSATTKPASSGRTWLIGPFVSGTAIAATAALASFYSLGEILYRNLFPTIANDALIYLAEARAFVQSGDIGPLHRGTGIQRRACRRPILTCRCFHSIWHMPYVREPAIQPQYADPSMTSRSAWPSRPQSQCWSLASRASRCRSAARWPTMLPPPHFWPLRPSAPSAHSSTCLSRAVVTPFALLPMLGLIGLTGEAARTLHCPSRCLSSLRVLPAFSRGSHRETLLSLPSWPPVFLAALLPAGGPCRQLLYAGGLLTCAAIAVGLHYVVAYLETGRFFGNGMNYYHYKGTALEAAFRNYGDWGSANLGLLDSLQKILSTKAHGQPPWRSWQPCFLLLLASQFFRKHWANSSLYLFPLDALGPLLLPTPADSIGMKVALIGNYRYAYTIFILAPVILATGLCAICDICRRLFGSKAGLTLLVAGSALLSTGAQLVCASGGRTPTLSTREFSGWKSR